jgi:hypothetical protein
MQSRDNSMAALGEDWAVIGFPLGFGSHYVMSIYCGHDTWPMNVQGLPGKPIIRPYSGTKDETKKAIEDISSEPCVTL